MIQLKENIASKQTAEYKCTNLFARVTRTIPIPPANHSRLFSIDKKSGLSNADKILEFCQTPRSMVEIAAMMGRSAVAWTKRGYVLPLLHSGRLVLTMPAKPTAVNQKYVVAENAVTIVSIESILEYCRMPRRKGEIYAHFGTSSWQMKSIIDPMIADGRLNRKRQEPDRLLPSPAQP